MAARTGANISNHRRARERLHRQVAYKLGLFVSSLYEKSAKSRRQSAVSRFETSKLNLKKATFFIRLK